MNIKTLNNKLMVKCLQTISIFVLILCSLSCKEKYEKTLLLLSPKESIVSDQRMVLDSIVVMKNKTTMLIRQYRGNGDCLEIKYIKNNNRYSELREKFHGVIEKSKYVKRLNNIDTLPIFNNTDTIFTYNSNRKYYPTTIDLSLGDAQYEVKKQKYTYVSTRQSIIDHLYKEYYYDKNFNIIKYIVKYRGSICVYR